MIRPLTISHAAEPSDVVAVLDALNISKKADYFRILAPAAGSDSRLCKICPETYSLVHHRCGASPTPRTCSRFATSCRVIEDAFSKMLDQQVFGSRMSPSMRARQLTNDLVALRALTQDRVSCADVLPSMTMPCLTFVGEADPRFPQVKQCASELRNATFFSLPDSDHVGTLTRLDIVGPQIKTFLDKGLGR